MTRLDAFSCISSGHVLSHLGKQIQTAEQKGNLYINRLLTSEDTPQALGSDFTVWASYEEAEARRHGPDIGACEESAADRMEVRTGRGYKCSAGLTTLRAIP